MLLKVTLLSLVLAVVTAKQNRISKRFLDNLINSNVIFNGGAYVNSNGNNNNNNIYNFYSNYNNQKMVNQNPGRQCLNDWIEYGGSCYLFYLHHKNWQDANAYCRRQNARLVEIESPSENLFLQSTGKRLKPTANYWIGGTDLQHVGTWTWASFGNPVIYNDWDKNQPDDSDENCIELKADFNLRWNNDQCSLHKDFICEM